MSSLDVNHSPLAYFLAGVLCTVLVMVLWRAGRFFLDLWLTRARAKQIEESSPHDQLAAQAWKRVSACRRRLRFNPNPNPEWIGPLIDEVPRLTKEIAAIYYPEHPEPVQAPRVSEFARATQFIATDIAELLQSGRVGHLIDVSAGRTVQAWKTGQRVWQNPKIKKARTFLEPLYKVGKPVWQVARYNSPITWLSMGASNAAVRTIQPAIVNIIARRAIDLYSGKLRDPFSPDTTIADVLAVVDAPLEQPLPSKGPTQFLRGVRERFRKKPPEDRDP